MGKLKEFLTAKIDGVLALMSWILFAVVVFAIAVEVAEAANPDFPGGELAAIEVSQDLEVSRHFPLDVLRASIIAPLTDRMTLEVGLSRETATVRPGLYMEFEDRLSITWRVRVYFGSRR